MCGIAGIVNFKGQAIENGRIRAMMDKMNHRGPDDEGIFLNANTGLGFVRLSIIDLTPAGHQPMFTNDGRHCIIFNGEVYNYLELRKVLEEKYAFKSHTDSEVVLYSYLEWGSECLGRLNGMFAFVIYNIQEESLFGVRDRFGIKPFYYHLSGDEFIFASEIPPILSAMRSKPEPNEEVILNYLLLNRTNYSSDTFFEQITKLPPGHFLELKEKVFQINQWYNLRNEIKGKVGFDSPAEYYKLFKDSIDLQLRSDVPVGICLSGGLDSSAIASAILKEHKHDKFNSYSAVYADTDKADESEYINEFQGSGMNMHFIHPDHLSLMRDLDQYLETLCEPVPGTSEYAEFKVMELAKSHSTVILNGQGADEVLGGYEYFYGAYLKELLFGLKFREFYSEILKQRKFRTLNKSLKYLIFFMLPARLKLVLLKDRREMVNRKFLLKHQIASINLLKNLYGFSTLQDYFLRHFEYKFEHHLMWADKSGMHFSVETRFPFLDHRLIERTLNTKTELIIKDGWTKYILREAFEGLMPEKIRKRKSKIGFETPENNWLRTDIFKSFIENILDSEQFNNRPYFNPLAIKKLWNDHLLGKVNEANTIWKIVHLELWLRKFID